MKEQLIEDYRKKVRELSEMIDKCHSWEIEKQNRLEMKRGCFNSFITDIERLGNENTDAAMKEGDEETTRFLEWVIRHYDKHSLGWIPAEYIYTCDSPKFTAAQLLEKFRTLPRSPSRE